MRRFPQNFFKLSCVSAALAATFSQSLLAQETPDEESVERVVVTGSRVAQDQSLEAASPVFAIDASSVKASGQLDLGALLRESPQLQASLPGSFSAFSGEPLAVMFQGLKVLALSTLILFPQRY
jgi:outer membrane cobalamin receptor